MTEFDYVVLAVLACSALLGFIRGFIKESFSLISYVLAGYGAILWGHKAFPWFFSFFNNYYISMVASYILVFIAILLIVGLINRTLSSMISYTGLGPADSGLGLLFGLIRGIIIVLIAAILLGYTDLPQSEWWQNAKFSPMVVDAIQHLKTFFPVDIVKYLPYSS